MPVSPPNTPSEMIAAGKALLAEWMTTFDSDNPLHNLAVVEIDRAFKLGDFLDQQKNKVKINTDKLKLYNTLTQSIIDFQPKGDADNQRKLGQLPGEVIGDGSSPGKDDAAVLARANAFLDDMHAIGMALDIRPPDATGKETRLTSVADLKVVTADTYNDWTNKLRNKTDFVNSTAQQDQFNLQAVLGMFNRAFEFATGSIKRNADTWLSIIHNVKAN